jgi:flagellar basal-body rod modification protein FlgD
MTMSTDAVSESILGSLSSSYVSPSTEADENDVQQEMFLKLLVAQMENQDPMNPTDATKFTGQLTQYSILEQSLTTNNILETISTQYTSQTAAGLTDYIGKVIEAGDITGTVEAVNFESDQAYFVVDGEMVDPSDVTAVYNTEASNFS